MSLIVIVVLKTDFSSKSEALNIFVSVSFKFKTNLNMPLNPIKCERLLSFSLIYNSMSVKTISNVEES